MIHQMTAYLETELRQAKTTLDNGCFEHNSVVEEAVAKANVDTLTKVLEKAKSIQLPF